MPKEITFDLTKDSQLYILQVIREWCQSMSKENLVAWIKAKNLETSNTKRKRSTYAKYSEAQIEKQIIEIDEQGKILEIESEIKISSLLPQILSYMNENYKGKELIGASKINNENGSIHYEALIKGKGIVFDSKGAFLKVTKD